MFGLIQVLQFFVFFCFAVPFFIFGTYGLILVYYRRGQQRSDKIGSDDVKFEPTVSVVTPTHNEESIMSKKIENLLSSNYPKDKLELIFVDDSTDSTPNIIQEYAERYPNVRLIKFSERMGYSPCMFAGVKAATGDIIVLSDAGSYHDGNTVQNLVRHFQDERIGAVTGKDVILNEDEAVGSSEAAYLRIYNFVRTSETNMDSTFYFKGEASAVRKNLISDLAGGNATFDTAIALFVRQKGYKAIFDPEAKFYEYAPKTRNDRIKQKTIRAAGWIRILLRFKGMAFRSRYGKFGLFTLPANYGMLIVTPISVLAGFVFLAVLTFFQPVPALYLWALIGLVSLISLIVAKRILITAIDFLVSLLRALFEVAFTRKRHDQIDKVLSTRR